MPRLGEKVGVQDDEVTSAKIKDGEIVNADIAAAAAIAYSKLATDPRIARIKTGTYTGDGTTSQAITGIGFQPKWVWVWRYLASEGWAAPHFKSDEESGDMSITITAANEGYRRDNRLISLDADGFTVDDDGNDSNPNTLNSTYIYIAFG